jgi:hypothetical protein
MSSYLDIIGGTILGGMIMLITLTASDLGIRSMYNHNADVVMQQNLRQLTDVVEFDLKKMGFGVPEAQLPQVIQVHEPDHFKFLVQLNMDPDASYKLPGILTYDQQIDTIEYKIISGPTFTVGDSTIVLYRVLRNVKIRGGSTHSFMLGLVSNNQVFNFYDQSGNKTTTTQAIRVVSVNLAALNPDVVLTPDYVSANLNEIRDIEYRRKELQRILQPTFWQYRKMVLQNMLR